jgi:hypothetical protein
MAKQVDNMTTASGRHMAELQKSIVNARKDGWISAGPILIKEHYLTQTMIKLKPLK